MRYKAIYSVHYSPNRTLEFKGEYDKDGNAKLRAVIKVLQADTIGELPDDIVAELLEQGSIRELTEQEQILDAIASGALVARKEHEDV